MQIDDAKLIKGWLCLKTQPAEALKWLCKFKQGKNYEIKLQRQKRSLEANAYAWVLLDKLSAALQTPKEELYKRYIRDIGGVSEVYSGETEAIKKLSREWESTGLGAQAEMFPSPKEGQTNVILYYGSHTYDTAQMSRLIDSIVQDCQAIGIETKTEEEINSLLSQWEERR